MGGHGTLQLVDHIDGVGKEDALSGDGGGVADGGGQMGFAQAGIAEEEQVFISVEEPQGKDGAGRFCRGGSGPRVQ